MNQQRLKDLQENLDLLYEKLAMFEQQLIIAASPPQRFELKKRISREIWPSIRKYEKEYWDLLPQEAILITDEEAEETLGNLDQAVTAIERVDNDRYPPEVLELLKEIRSKLDEPGTAAAAKLKVALPIVPLLASYELEMDTEGMLSQLWRGLRDRLKR